MDERIDRLLGIAYRAIITVDEGHLSNSIEASELGKANAAAHLAGVLIRREGRVSKVAKSTTADEENDLIETYKMIIVALLRRFKMPAIGLTGLAMDESIGKTIEIQSTPHGGKFIRVVDYDPFVN